MVYKIYFKLIYKVKICLHTMTMSLHEISSHNIQSFNIHQQVLITSVSSSDHSYLQFNLTLFMTLNQNFNISYFEQKRLN